MECSLSSMVKDDDCLFDLGASRVQPKHVVVRLCRIWTISAKSNEPAESRMAA